LARTSGILKFGGVILGLFVLTSFLQGRGLVPTASGLGASLQSIKDALNPDIITGATGAESGLEVDIGGGEPIITGTQTIVEDTPTTTPTSFPTIRFTNFENLLSSFIPSSGEFLRFTQPIRFGGGGTSLGVFGTRGIITNEIGVSGLRLPPRAIARTEPTLFGIRETSRGFLPVAGSAALFERLRQNLARSQP